MRQFLIIIVLLLLFMAQVAQALMFVGSVSTTLGPISAQSDWTVAYDALWTFYTQYDNFIWWGRYGSNREWGAFRFTLPSALPDNCTIVSATLELYGGSTAACDDSYIYVVASSDAGQATTAGERPSIDGGSVNTYPNSAEGAGSIHWTENYTASTWNDVDITGLIQYLVDTYNGIASAAHIVVYISGDDGIATGTESTAAATESGSNLAKLTIVYR